MIEFLRTVVTQADLLEHLKVKSKDEVITTAEQFGCPFTEPEFNSLVWDLEVYLASKRGEKFDPRFPLWSTMWGKYYLEYLVINLMSSFTEADFDVVMAGQGG
ncbi:MAG: hypothetical protein ABIZ05_08810 [Pseudonocardiaceae bacterium]